MTIAMASSEMFPYVKSGGLADAVGGLGKELSRYEETIAILPLYDRIDRERYDIRPASIEFTVRTGEKEYDISVYHTSAGGVRSYFIHHPLLCEGESLYESPRNDLRFGLFAHALCHLIGRYVPVDILHLHDWQSALAAPLAKTRYGLSCSIVLTIHNLAFQGVFPKEAIERLDLGWELFTMDRLEFYDRVNFLKGGIAYADAVTTVSPTYAREITTAEFGANLESFLKRYEAKISGILNGIDSVEFDPSNDPALTHPFDARHLGRKKEEKRALCRELSIQEDSRPLLAYVGRLAEQKGIGELAALVGAISDAPINIVILGSGESHYESMCRALQSDNVKVVLRYDESLSRRIYAASDFFLMPSQFEPCGLAQMIAMRYGSIPIVRKTGGLNDTVVDFCDTVAFQVPESAGIGIAMERCDTESFMHAIIKALALYVNEEMMREFIVYNMNKDFSWHRAAISYRALYRSIHVQKG